MNRKINLISHESQHLDGLENISIQLIDSIYPYSSEILVCKYFNIFEEKDADKALEVLIDKIRPRGQLILGVINLNKICSDLLNKKITTLDFIQFIKNIHNHFTIDDIAEYINKKTDIQILEINHDQNYIDFITITKQK